jgi:hypothetical protein
MPSRKSWREKLVVSKGKKFVVEDFEKSLARL